MANHEGYPDPTADMAIANVMRKYKQKKKRNDQRKARNERKGGEKGVKSQHTAKP